MTEGEKRVKEALRGCAEGGVPDTVDLWPGIRERTAARRRRSRRAGFVPRTRAGLALAALSVLLLSTGAYAASGWVYDLFQAELPGADAKNVGVEIGQKRTEGDATVSLEWAYADEEFVVIGFGVEDLKEGRRNAGHRVELQPVLASGPAPTGPLPFDVVELADEGSGKNLDLIDGTGRVDDEGTWRGPLANTAIFSTPKGFDSGEKHRLRLEVPLEETPVFSTVEEGEEGVRLEPKPPIGPFVFEFEIPVRPAPVVEMDQQAEANGLTLRLDRVVASPARPQAVICFEPPDDEHEWVPMVKTEPASREPIESTPLGDGCYSVPLYGPLSEPTDGRSSVTVTELMGVPGEDAVEPQMMQPEMLPGPWKFDFEVPGP